MREARSSKNSEMKFLLFGYIIMANLQFYDANQIELGKYFNGKFHCRK